MKTPHLFDTSFLFNLQCTFQALSEVPGLQPYEVTALKDLGDTLEVISQNPEDKGVTPALERHFQEMRKLSWQARTDTARRATMSAAHTLVDSIRCVMGSKAAFGKRGSAEG